MPPRNLCELLLRDAASLLVTSQLISQSLLALRPKCEFSRELAATVDTMVTINDSGASRLKPPLTEAGASQTVAADTTTNMLVTDFFTRLPVVAPGVLAAEIIVNLRLLAQHLELKTRLAAEEALLVGQNRLSQALVAWSAEWRAFSGALRDATVRARARAYIADLDESVTTQGA